MVPTRAIFPMVQNIKHEKFSMVPIKIVEIRLDQKKN